jgi:hypothetical protein
MAAPLIEGGYLAESGACLLLARDPASYPLATLWQHLRGSRPATGAIPAVGLWLDAAEQAAVAQGELPFREWLAQVGHLPPSTAGGGAGEKTARSQ